LNRYRHPGTEGIFWIRKIFEKRGHLCVSIPYYFLERLKTWQKKTLYLEYDDSLIEHGIDPKMVSLHSGIDNNSVKIYSEKRASKKNRFFYYIIPDELIPRLGWKDKDSIIIRPNRHDIPYLDFQRLDDLKRTVREIRKLGGFKRRYSAHTWAFREHHVVVPVDIMDELDISWWRRKRRAYLI
jgi:hypothetical protein